MATTVETKESKLTNELIGETPAKNLKEMRERKFIFMNYQNNGFSAIDGADEILMRILDGYQLMAESPTTLGGSTAFYKIGEHPLWNEPGALERMMGNMMEDFSIKQAAYITKHLPQTDKAKMLYAKHGLTPDAESSQEYWDTFANSPTFHTIAQFTSIPEAHRTQLVYHKALANGIIHIGEVPEEKRDYRAWLEACSVRHNFGKSITREVLSLVPAEHKTVELIESATRTMAVGTCDLLDLIPKNALTRTTAANLARICVCYHDRIIDADTLTKIQCDDEHFTNGGNTDCYAERREKHGGCGSEICSAVKLCYNCPLTRCQVCTPHATCRSCRFKAWAATAGGN